MSADPVFTGGARSPEPLVRELHPLRVGSETVAVRSWPQDRKTVAGGDESSSETVCPLSAHLRPKSSTARQKETSGSLFSTSETTTSKTCSERFQIERRN